MVEPLCHNVHSGTHGQRVIDVGLREQDVHKNRQQLSVLNKDQRGVNQSIWEIGNRPRLELIED